MRNNRSPHEKKMQIWYGILVSGCIVSGGIVAFVSIFGGQLNCPTTDEVGLCWNLDVLAILLFTVSMGGIFITLLIDEPRKKNRR